MINIPPIKPRTDIKAEVLADVTKTWKVGQVLNATVNKGGEPLDTVQLRIGQHLLESRTPISLKAGDNIQLLVKELSIEPLLSIKTQISTREAAIQLLRNYINSQQNIKPLLEISQKVQLNEPADSIIKARLQQFIDLIGKPEQAADAKQLKTLIQNTGVFLEPRLLSTKKPGLAQGNLNNEIKAQLNIIKQLIETELPAITKSDSHKTIKLDTTISQFLRGEINIKELAQLLSARLPADKVKIIISHLQADQSTKPLTKELLPVSITQLITHIRTQPNSKTLADALISLLLKLPSINDLKTQIDNLLNKITSQQLLPLTKDADTPQFFLFDLPVKHNKETTVFQFRIDKEKKTATDKESGWSVSINFEFDELGPIQTKLKLYENTISTLFHAERPSTASKIRSHLPVLETALKNAGFNISNIDILEQRIQQPRNIPRDIHFLDEKA